MNVFELISTKRPVFATIKGEILEIDYASKYKNSYEDVKNIEYLGCGNYYSYDGTLNVDKSKMYFWRRQTNNLSTKIVMIEKY